MSRCDIARSHKSAQLCVTSRKNLTARGVTAAAAAAVVSVTFSDKATYASGRQSNTSELTRLTSVTSARFAHTHDCVQRRAVYTILSTALRIPRKTSATLLFTIEFDDWILWGQPLLDRTSSHRAVAMNVVRTLANWGTGASAMFFRRIPISGKPAQIPRERPPLQWRPNRRNDARSNYNGWIESCWPTMNQRHQLDASMVCVCHWQISSVRIRNRNGRTFYTLVVYCRDR